MINPTGTGARSPASATTSPAGDSRVLERNAGGSRVVPAAKVAVEADRSHPHHPTPGQVAEDLIAVAGRQPDAFLDRGDVLGAFDVGPVGSGVEGGQCVKDAQLDLADPATVTHPTQILNARRNAHASSADATSTVASSTVKGPALACKRSQSNRPRSSSESSLP